MTMATVTVSEKGQVSLPTALRQRLGIQQGDTLVLRESGGRVVLEPAGSVERKLSLLEDAELLGLLLVEQESLRKDWDNSADERWNDV